MNTINKNRKKLNIHFTGIKGVGMTPLAIFAKEAGCKVSGSDIEEEFITDVSLQKVGITPLIGFSKDHVQKNTDLVIATGAHGGLDNKEAKRAKELGIKVVTQGEAVGLFMDGSLFGRKFDGITVTGTHGKTTTTAILSTILKNCNMDPSYIIGTGSVSSLGTPGHYGKGQYFIAEGDEYATEPKYDKTIKFMWQHPKIAIFTNIEYDHSDIYSSIDEVRNAFLEFAKQLPPNGALVVNGDDPQTQILLRKYMGNVITFGKNPKNNFVIERISLSDSKTFFWMESSHTSLGEFSLNVMGEHNVLNAAASVVVALECGIPIDRLKKALSLYIGSKRRAEFIGTTKNGALLFDDYAHHPTEIKKSLAAFKSSYPRCRIVCIFQPHTYTRTKKFFNEFVHSFSQADCVILTDIYASLREEQDPAVSSRILAEEMKRFHKDIMYIPDALSVIEYIARKDYGQDTIVLTMGAGDVYKISGELRVES